ncbi:MAG: hypothetical protein ABTQ31_02630 [Rhizobiaceae bacterium]
MGFHTEFFSRPRPTEQAGYRASLALIPSMCRADRVDVVARPADFPRRGRDPLTRN